MLMFIPRYLKWFRMQPWHKQSLPNKSPKDEFRGLSTSIPSLSSSKSWSIMKYPHQNSNQRPDDPIPGISSNIQGLVSGRSQSWTSGSRDRPEKPPVAKYLRKSIGNHHPKYVVDFFGGSNLKFTRNDKESTHIKKYKQRLMPKRSVAWETTCDLYHSAICPCVWIYLIYFQGFKWWNRTPVSKLVSLMNVTS